MPRARRKCRWCDPKKWGMKPAEKAPEDARLTVRSKADKGGPWVLVGRRVTVAAAAVIQGVFSKLEKANKLTMRGAVRELGEEFPKHGFKPLHRTIVERWVRQYQGTEEFTAPYAEADAPEAIHDAHAAPRDRCGENTRVLRLRGRDLPEALSRAIAERLRTFAAGEGRLHEDFGAITDLFAAHGIKPPAHNAIRSWMVGVQRDRRRDPSGVASAPAPKRVHNARFVAKVKPPKKERRARVELPPGPWEAGLPALTVPERNLLRIVAAHPEGITYNEIAAILKRTVTLGRAAVRSLRDRLAEHGIAFGDVLTFTGKANRGHRIYPGELLTGAPTSA